MEEEEIIRMQLKHWHGARITLDRNDPSYDEKLKKYKEEISNLRKQYAKFKFAEKEKQKEGRKK